MKRIFAFIISICFLLYLSACTKENISNTNNPQHNSSYEDLQSNNAADVSSGPSISSETGETSDTSDTSDTSETSDTSDTSDINESTETSLSDETNNTTTIDNLTPTYAPPSLEELKQLVERLSGRWYLEGFSDIYLDITYEPNDSLQSSFMYITSNNFSFLDTSIVECGPDFFNEYAIYPVQLKDESKYPNGFSWSSGMMVRLYKWSNTLLENSIRIDETCIYIHSYKFIRTQGSKNQHTELGVLGDGEEHSFSKKVIESTPTTYGRTIYTCKICGYSYEEEHHTQITNLYFGESEYTLNIGNVIKIEPIIEPFDASQISLSWSSSNTDIAIVDNNGCVSAINAGVAVITTRESNGCEAHYFVRVLQDVVSPPPPVYVDGIKLSETSLALTVGDTQQITAIITPENADNKSIVWKSSNPDVAKVSSSGIITAQKEGVSVVTATTKDGELTASCEVKVSIVPISGITLDKTSLKLLLDETYQLIATISPQNATYKNIVWTSNNIAVVQVSSSGKVTAKGKGCTTVTATTDNGNIVARCTITVEEPSLTVNADLSVGIKVLPSGFIRGVFVTTSTTGGSGNYIEYAIKVYFDGVLAVEVPYNEAVVTIANGTYTVEVYVKDSSGNEARTTETMTISGY